MLIPKTGVVINMIKRLSIVPLVVKDLDEVSIFILKN